MELLEALSRRRMVRAFSSTALDPATLDQLLDRARRAPSAGNTQAVGFVVLDHPGTVGAYWDISLPAARRAGFRWQGLLEAPVLVLVTIRPSAYLERYAQADKAPAGRGDAFDQWPVPYWWVDAGAVIQNLLLLAVDGGLGACLFGPFDHEPALSRAFGLSSDERIVATVALGHTLPDEPGRSASRPRRPLAEVIRRPDLPAPPPAGR